MVQHLRGMQRQQQVDDDKCEEIIEAIQRATSFLTSLLDHHRALTPQGSVQTARPNPHQGICQRVATGRRGAPSYNITTDQLNSLMDVKMSATNMKELLGAKSRQTIYNHLKKNKTPSRRERFADISDEDLMKVIHKISTECPNAGYREVHSRLFVEQKLCVPLSRVMRLLRAVNPLGTASRWARAIHRRTYSVSGPNSLWHLDTNHALRRYVKKVLKIQFHRFKL